MDPDAALARVRDAIRQLLNDPSDEVQELIDAWATLDGWLIGGGFLPRDWRTR